MISKCIFYVYVRRLKHQNQAKWKQTEPYVSTYKTPKEGSLLGVLSRILHSPKPMPQKNDYHYNDTNHGRKITGNTSHK